MFDMMGKLNELKKSVEQTRARLADIPVHAEAGHGLVQVHGNALREIQRIEIDDSLLQPAKKEELEDYLLTAANRMLQAAKEKEEAELKNAAGGLIPPGMGF